MAGNKSYQLEYVIRSSPTILFNFLTTPSGLAQWFADNVDINDGVYTFTWEGFDENAKIVDSVENEFVRYQWEDGNDAEYFEFKIQKAEVTGDTILIITDFADEHDIDDQKLLWDSQVKTLLQQIGG